MFFHKALVFSTLFLSAFSSPQQQSATRTHEDRITDWDALQSLLDTIDTTVLHGVLHQLTPKFKDGIFSKDRSAIEHVHSQNPAVATKLVHIALKRQASNSTHSSTIVSPASTSEVKSSISSKLSSQIHASTVPPKTTLTVAPTHPSNAVPISTGHGGVVYSTIGGGVVTETSQVVGVSFTPSTSYHLYYTTLPNGQVETSTSVVVVNAPQTSSAGTAAGAAATTSPGLQNTGSAVVQIGTTVIGVVCAAVAFLL